MNRRLLGFLLIALLACIVLLAPRSASSEPIRFDDGEGGYIILDLTKQGDRDRLLEFTESPKVRLCYARADYSLELFERRDTESEAQHLAEVKANYDRTVDEGAPASWYVYIDFQRSVRDIHRPATTRNGSSISGYYFEDPDAFWEREFKWCFTLRGRTP